MKEETFPQRVDRIMRDQNVGMASAVYVAKCEINIEQAKKEKLNA